jgi:hypothetical protein
MIKPKFFYLPFAAVAFIGLEARCRQELLMLL